MWDDLCFKSLSQLCFHWFDSISVQLSTSSAQEIDFHALYRHDVLKAQFLGDLGCFSKLQPCQAGNIFCWVIFWMFCSSGIHLV